MYWNVFQSNFCNLPKNEHFQFTRDQFLERLFFVKQYTNIEHKFYLEMKNRNLITRNQNKITLDMRQRLWNAHHKMLEHLNKRSTEILETQVLLNVLAEMSKEIKTPELEGYLNASTHDHLMLIRPLFVTKTSRNTTNSNNIYDYSLGFKWYPWSDNSFDVPVHLSARVIRVASTLVCTIATDGSKKNMVVARWVSRKERAVTIDKEELKRTKEAMFGSLHISDLTFMKLLIRMFNSLCLLDDARLLMLSVLNEVATKKKVHDSEGHQLISVA
jgi:hypothetical protein